MSKKTAIASLAFIGLFALSGCLKEDASYTLREDNMVDGVLVLALHNDSAGDPPTDTVHDVPAIAAKYDHTTITDLGQPNWTGSRITFTDEPIGTFEAATENWDIAVSRSGNQYVVSGTALDPTEESSKQTIRDNGGSSVLSITFPGTVHEHNGTLSGRTVTWNLLTVTEAPYARGSAIPDAPPPEPDPVVTVVITPEPIVTPEESPSAPPSASPTPAPDSEGSSTIPGWVWIVGGVLIAALAGMIGFALAGRKRLTPEPADTVAKTATESKGKGKPSSKPVEEDEEKEQGKKPKKKSPKKPQPEE